MIFSFGSHLYNGVKIKKERITCMRLQNSEISSFISRVENEMRLCAHILYMHTASFHSQPSIWEVKAIYMRAEQVTKLCKQRRKMRMKVRYQ